MARSYETPDISTVIQPLYPELFRRLGAAGVVPSGPGLAWYEATGEGESVMVHAGVTVTADPCGRDFASSTCPRAHRGDDHPPGPMDEGGGGRRPARPPRHRCHRR